MAGTLTVGTLSDETNSTSATNVIRGSSRAWISLAGQATPASINASYGISSLTDGGAGLYTPNFSVAFSDTSYSHVYGMGDISGVGNEHAIFDSWAVGSVRCLTSLSGDSWGDAFRVCIVFNR